MKIKNKIYDTGLDKWTHGQKIPADWHCYLGPCPDCGCRTFDYGGGWRCVELYCARSANNPTPSVGAKPTWWQTDVNIKKDGGHWHSFRDGYLNPMESKEGFGITPQEAVLNLLANEELTNEKTRTN